MKLLLDTQAFLWAIQEPERLSAQVQGLLRDAAVPRWLSAVALWEIAVKIQIGKLELPGEPSYCFRHMLALKAQILDIGARHALGVLSLPLLHQDPFDRLLVAQAREEGMTLVTADSFLQQYDVPTIK